MSYTVVALPGDGIGPEVMAVARAVVDAIATQHGLEIDYKEYPMGGCALDRDGVPLPAATRAASEQADAVLLGAVGGPQWSAPNIEQRPEYGLLQLRAALGTFANLRPVAPHPVAMTASPLRPERLAGVDIMVVRELTGGIYFGEKQEGDELASDLCTYSREEIARIIRAAATLAQSRRGKLTSVDKSNVLATSRLWRRVCDEIMATEFPGVELEHLLVDAAAMHLLSRPADFDVMVTENMFGDILTDEASMLAGSLGLLPSASLGTRRSASGVVGLYEPIHGSAPDIAGQGVANPCGMVASVAMMFRHSLNLPEIAARIDLAVSHSLAAGCLTRDLGGTASTLDMQAAILASLAAS